MSYDHERYPNDDINLFGLTQEKLDEEEEERLLYGLCYPIEDALIALQDVIDELNH